MKRRHAALAVLVLALLPFACVQVTERPSNDRDWSPDQKVLARAEFDGDKETVVLVTQARDFSTVGVILNRPTPAFHVLKGVYLSMHPENVEKLASGSARYRLFAGFSGWAPRQLEA